MGVEDQRTHTIEVLEFRVSGSGHQRLHRMGGRTTCTSNVTTPHSPLLKAGRVRFGPSLRGLRRVVLLVVHTGYAGRRPGEGRNRSRLRTPLNIRPG